MRTFIAWVIANAEVASTVIIAVWLLVACLCGGITGEMFSSMVIVSLFLFGVLRFFGVTWLGVIISIVAYVYIFELSTAVFWGMLVPATVISTAAAAFTAINFDEVVSRRMRYVNSNVSMFENTLKYTINRFIATFLYSSAMMLLFILGTNVMVSGDK